MFYLLSLINNSSETDEYDSEDEAIREALMRDNQDVPYGIYNHFGVYVAIVFMNQVWR